MLPGGAGLLGWLVTAVPGAGLLRDGQKLLVPYVLLLAVTGALGAERLAGRLATRFDLATGRVLLAGAALLPVAVLPGGAGRLRPVAWPADWETVARLVDERPGEVVSLPFQEYQSYAWNGGRVVIDPAPRYLGVSVLIDDTLRVDGTAVAGEDPRAARLRELLAAGEPVGPGCGPCTPGPSWRCTRIRRGVRRRGRATPARWAWRTCWPERWCWSSFLRALRDGATAW